MQSPRALALGLTFALLASAAAAPVVSNLRAAQRPGTKFVDIFYDVAAGGDAVTVTVSVSSDGGASYTVPAATFIGDFGSGVRAGTDRHVVWSAGVDWNGQFTARGRVRVTAQEGTGPAGMALIPAGYFQMGDNFGVQNDALVRTVYVSDFYLDRFEVTKELWDSVHAYAIPHGYDFTGQSTGAGANHPVQNLSWHDAVKWCNARSQREGRTPAYYTDTAQTKVYQRGEVDLTAAMVKWTGNGYRLPTEAQWEKAARGGLVGQHFPWSSSSSSYATDLSGSKANYNDSGDPFEPNLGTTPVGYYNGKQIPAGSDMANGYGLYDMAGNVWEWCWDWYRAYPAGSQTDPRGDWPGSSRVFRGGGWAHGAGILRCAYRDGYGSAFRGSFLGFRCALGQP